MEVVRYADGSILVRVLPPHRDGLLSALIYQLHKYDVGSSQHELAVASVKDRCLLHQPAPLSEDQHIELLADLFHQWIDLYVEAGPLLVFRNNLSCRGTLRVVRRVRQKETRQSSTSHYDVCLQRIKNPKPAIPLAPSPYAVSVLCPFFIYYAFLMLIMFLILFMFKCSSPPTRTPRTHRILQTSLQSHPAPS